MWLASLSPADDDLSRSTSMDFNMENSNDTMKDYILGLIFLYV